MRPAEPPALSLPDHAQRPHGKPTIIHNPPKMTATEPLTNAHSDAYPPTPTKIFPSLPTGPIAQRVPQLTTKSLPAIHIALRPHLHSGDVDATLCCDRARTDLTWHHRVANAHRVHEGQHVTDMGSNTTWDLSRTAFR